MIWAIVKTRFEAVHCWPDAPQNTPEAHLANEHRHEFHVRLWVEQRHDDRDVEYLWLKRKLTELLRGGSLGHLSCEMLATSIIEMTRRLVGDDRRIRCEVLEDGENGALVE